MDITIVHIHEELNLKYRLFFLVKISALFHGN